MNSSTQLPSPTRRQLIAAGALATSSILPAAAQEGPYPNKPLKFAVAFGAGSAADVVARFVANYITKTTGQPVVVENKVGVNGVLAAQFLALSPPDGYTVLITTQAQVTNPSFYKKLPFDTVADFLPVSTIGRGALVIVSPPDFPANNVRELIALLRQNPGKTSYGYGNASSRVGPELFKMQTKTFMLPIPYRSMPQAITDLIGRQVQVAWADPVTGLGQVKAGKLKALGVTSSRRFPTAPEIPTVIEQGVPGHEIYAWTGAYLPAKTPLPIAARLNELVQAAIKSDPGFFEKFSGEGFPQSLPEMAKFQTAELTQWARVAKNAGIEAE
ncbi:tripartite tricarboxylate transporter substrate-binding protein [Variovorax sp. PCZ-1]|uniref:Bug family tripartite tricarboxylate transporter substrate binding protein n=1 Tax=Variovorax sp. PCZ-1 TaxID=2835533 RepID=UPI001BCD1921|nr:tripartite tricarboxylate transporter substrate-binding protein [Variovorax sp. PCZ-1]MBS7806073.1 tripartite tricarboxylate transporter substrate binding protein [Variovorax sp. PCZ-1]